MAEAGSEDEDEEEEDREAEGKKKHRSKAAAPPPKMDPRKKKVLREHPLHITLTIQTKVAEFCTLAHIFAFSTDSGLAGPFY